MKLFQIVILMASFGFCAGCKPTQAELQWQQNYHQDFIQSNLVVVIYDSCEYLSYSTGGSSGLLTHKGNCTNLIHKH